MSTLAKIKALSADTFIYGTSTIVVRFISIFLVPIYTRIFDPADFGIVNLVNTSLMLIGIFVIAGLDNAAARWYWDSEDDKEMRITFSSWFWTQFAVSAAVVLLISSFSVGISQLVIGNTHASLLFILAAANLPFTTLNLVYTSWLRIRKKALPSVLFSLLNSILTIALALLLVVVLDLGLPGVFLAQLISNILCSVPAAMGLSKLIQLRYFRKSRVMEMLRFSVPLVPAALAFWMLNSAGSFFINHFGSKADVGLFQIGTSIAAVSGMLFWAFLQAWSPFAMSIHKEPDAKNTYAKVFDVYISLGSLFVLFIFLFSPQILGLIATESYVPASLVAGILSINIFIANIAQVTSIGAAIVKTSKPYLTGVFIGSAVSVLSYLILIPVFNKEGAALSSLTGSTLIAIYVTIRSQRLYRIPYQFKKNIAIVLTLAVSCLASLFLAKAAPDVILLLKLAILIFFVLFLAIVNRNLAIKLISSLSYFPSLNVTQK